MEKTVKRNNDVNGKVPEPAANPAGYDGKGVPVPGLGPQGRPAANVRLGAGNGQPLESSGQQRPLRVVNPIQSGQQSPIIRDVRAGVTEAPRQSEPLRQPQPAWPSYGPQTMEPPRPQHMAQNVRQRAGHSPVFVPSAQSGSVGPHGQASFSQYVQNGSHQYRASSSLQQEPVPQTGFPQTQYGQQQQYREAPYVQQGQYREPAYGLQGQQNPYQQGSYPQTGVPQGQPQYSQPFQMQQSPAGAGPQNQAPLDMAPPRRRWRPGCSCGCIFWAFILVLAGTAGYGVLHWTKLDDQGKHALIEQVVDKIKGLPLSDIKNFCSKYMESTPPPPPINESGDNGVIQPKTPERVPHWPGSPDAAQPAQPAPQQQSSGVVSQAVAPGQQPPATLPGTGAVGDGSQVTNPNIAHPVDIPLVKKSAARIAGRRGSNQTRHILVQYAFSPSFKPAQSAAFADAFAEALTSEVQSKGGAGQDSSARVRELHREVAAESARTAAALTGIASVQNLPARLQELTALDQRVSSADAAVNMMRSEMQSLRSSGAAPADMREAERRMDTITDNLAKAASARTAAKEQLVNEIRTASGTTSLDTDALFSLAQTVGKMEASGMRPGAVHTASQALRDLASRLNSSPAGGTR